MTPVHEVRLEAYQKLALSADAGDPLLFDELVKETVELLKNTPLRNRIERILKTYINTFEKSNCMNLCVLVDRMYFKNNHLALKWCPDSQTDLGLAQKFPIKVLVVAFLPTNEKQLEVWQKTFVNLTSLERIYIEEWRGCLNNTMLDSLRQVTCLYQLKIFSWVNIKESMLGLPTAAFPLSLLTSLRRLDFGPVMDDKILKAICNLSLEKLVIRTPRFNTHSFVRLCHMTSLTSLTLGTDFRFSLFFISRLINLRVFRLLSPIEINEVSKQALAQCPLDHLALPCKTTVEALKSRFNHKEKLP